MADFGPVRATTISFLIAIQIAACSRETEAPAQNDVEVAESVRETSSPDPAEYAAERLEIYAPVRLSADLTTLSDQERRMLVPLIRASQVVNEIFWRNAYGDPVPLLARLDDESVRAFVEINYGPWDRLDDDRPFVPGVGPRPPGANFYPLDMTRAEFESADLPDKTGSYTLIRRTPAGTLETIPYHVAYASYVDRAAAQLRVAAGLAENAALAHYLELRAEALLTDEYRKSDEAWLDMKDNRVDIVIGPIETYEDKLFGYKAAYEAYVLIKNREWSDRLSRYAALLPELQRSLPVPEQYKRERPGTDSDLNAYDVVYYAGDANAGSKTVAINLPNDEQVQLTKGTRRLQLKNALRAKFDEILVPIADELIAPEQRDAISFDAFFENVMFHEVAHGLGVKNTIDGSGTVRKALRENASALEEAKADILGLYMITQLIERGELEAKSAEGHFVTFLAGFLRSVRFGAASAHGQANMLEFNDFERQGAFSVDPETGRYRVDFDRMQAAVNSLARRILTLQGDGDYAGVKSLLDQDGTVHPGLAASLARLAAAGIPVDVVFEQGLDVLGLDSEE
jgi:hypothetical protein